MAGGGGGYQKMVINFLVKKPVHAYVGGAAFLYSWRVYQTNSNYNYWFGKIHMDRMIARGQL